MLALSLPMMGEPPKSVFLLHHVSQLEGPPPLFCHTLMAVPQWNGASAAGALQGSWALPSNTTTTVCFA